jgi:hypothetical protein
VRDEQLTIAKLTVFLSEFQVLSDRLETSDKLRIVLNTVQSKTLNCVGWVDARKPNIFEILLGCVVT